MKRSHVLLKWFLFLMKNGPFSRNLKVYPDFLLPRKCVIICPNSKRFCPEKRQNDSKIFKNTVINFLILCGSCPSLEVSLMCSNGVSRSCNFAESLKQIWGSLAFFQLTHYFMHAIQARIKKQRNNHSNCQS